VAYDRRSPLSCRLHSCENKGGQFPVHLFHYARKRMQSFAVGSEIHCFAVQEMEIQHGPQVRRSQNWSHKWNSRYTQSILKIRSSKAGLIYRSNHGELTVDEMSVGTFPKRSSRRVSAGTVNLLFVATSSTFDSKELDFFGCTMSRCLLISEINKSFTRKNYRGVIEVQYHTCQ